MTDQPRPDQEKAADPFVRAEKAAAVEAAELTAESTNAKAPDEPPKIAPKPRAATGSVTATPAASQPTATHAASGTPRVPATSAPPGARKEPAAGASGTNVIRRREAGRVEAESIHLSQGGIREAVATNVTVTQGGIGRLRATDVAVSQGGVGVARADHLSVEFGGIGAALAGEVHVSQSAARTVVARDVHVEQSFVRSIMANRVTMGRQSGAFMVVARTVEGEVRTLLDWRGALAFGAAFGLVAGLFRRRR